MVSGTESAKSAGVKKKLLAMCGRLKRFINSLGSGHECNICGRTFFRFKPFTFEDAPAPKMFRLSAPDMKNYRCVYCYNGSGVRSKLAFMRSRGIFEKLRDVDILHFA